MALPSYPSSGLPLVFCNFGLGLLPGRTTLTSRCGKRIHGLTQLPGRHAMSVLEAGAWGVLPKLGLAAGQLQHYMG